MKTKQEININYLLTFSFMVTMSKRALYCNWTWECGVIEDCIDIYNIILRASVFFDGPKQR